MGDAKAKAGGGPEGGAGTHGAPDTAGTAGGGMVGLAGITLQTNRGVRRLGAGGLGSSACIAHAAEGGGEQGGGGWHESGCGGVPD